MKQEQIQPKITVKKDYIIIEYTNLITILSEKKVIAFYTPINNLLYFNPKDLSIIKSLKKPYSLIAKNLFIEQYTNALSRFKLN